MYNSTQKNIDKATSFIQIKPQNIIYTGVAGTGKTHRLQQIADNYTEVIQPLNLKSILNTLVEPLNWREVLCLIFMEQQGQGIELLTISDIIEHDFFQVKALQNGRSRYFNKTASSILAKYSAVHSKTVKQVNKATQSYFDKDETSRWYLLQEAIPLLTDLQVLLADYYSSSRQMKQNRIERYAFVSFHQSYGYDEFVEGIRPLIDESTGQMRYAIQQGVFLHLCEQAKQDPQHRYAMLIDEINRANVTQVFGELMSLIEDSKRLGQSDELRVQLAYSRQSFGVPSNVDIYATMNTQDYSLVNLDSAFRRRFQFVSLVPDSRVLGYIQDMHGSDISLSKLLDGMNKRITYFLGAECQLGHAYLCPVRDMMDLTEVMLKQILPQLISHASHNPSVLTSILRLEKTAWLVDISNSEGMDEIVNSVISPSPKYIINPRLLSILDNQTAEASLLDSQLFKYLY